MPLLFNGKPLEEKEYQSLVKDLKPKGKNQTVTFVLKNAQPLLRFTERGEKLISNGGTRPLSTSCIAKIGGVDGELVYYESKGQIQGKGGMEVNYEPKYVYFTAHELIVNAEKNSSLFDYLCLNSENELRANDFGKYPSFKMVDTSEPMKRNVVTREEKLKAYDMVREAWDKNKPKFKALYQSLGKTDWVELSNIKDYDTIKAPVYDLCESDPKKVIRLLESASLDVGATVTQAMERGVLKADKLAYYWNKTGKKIWSIPGGKSEEEGFDLFVNFLRMEDKSGAFEQIKKETAIEAINV